MGADRMTTADKIDNLIDLATKSRRTTEAMHINPTEANNKADADAYAAFIMAAVNLKMELSK